MPMSHAKLARSALRDAGLGLAIYTGIAILALEDRAQTGHALADFSTFSANASSIWRSDSSILTLFVLGLLFALLIAFTLTVWRHFGRNFALTRARHGQAQHWSVSGSRTYRKKV